MRRNLSIGAAVICWIIVILCLLLDPDNFAGDDIENIVPIVVLAIIASIQVLFVPKKEL